MMYVVGIFLIACGFCAIMMGIGTIEPPPWAKSHQTILVWMGRMAIPAGIFILLLGAGISPRQLSDWFQDIMTSGGGKGTG